MLKVSFWTGKEGAMLTHSKGLAQQEIDELAKLKAGDRLVIWPNTFKNGEYSPDFTLKKYLALNKVEPVAVEVEVATADSTVSATSSTVETAKAASE